VSSASAASSAEVSSASAAESSAVSSAAAVSSVVAAASLDALSLLLPQPTNMVAATDTHNNALRTFFFIFLTSHKIFCLY
jgi:hypothetical protein